MAVRYIGTSISGLSGDTKPTPSANEMGLIFTETDTNKLFIRDDNSWDEISPSTLLITDNESTNENNLIPFVANAATATGQQSLEMDGNVYYNPSTGTVTSTVFAGAVTASSITLNGDITTAAAQDWDLVDNNASALSFDASGAAGILAIDTQNGAERVTMSGDLLVSGDFTVSGTTTTVSSTTITVADPLIALATTNTGNSVDIGFYGRYRTNGTNLYTGLVWDGSASKYILFHANQAAPTTTVNTGGTGHATSTLVANLEGTADLATSITATANNSTNETVYPTFVDGATGTQGLETDTGLTYNPSTGTLTVENNGFAGGIIRGYSTTAGTTSYLTLSRSNHGTLGTHGAVDANDVLGNINFTGSDGDSFETGSRISAIPTETFSNSARGTKLVFSTVDNTTTTLDERMTIDHNGNVGIGVAPTGFASSASQLVVGSGSGSQGLTIYAQDNNYSNIAFTHPGDPDGWQGYIQYGHGSAGDKLIFGVNGAATMIAEGTGKIFINETANAGMTTGLTINQGGADNEIFALKSSDIAHGSTSQGETDTFLSIRKSDGSLGGVQLRAFGVDTASLPLLMQFAGYGGQASATKTTSGYGLFDFICAEHDGSNGLADITGDGNVFSVRARVGGAYVTRMIVDEDGDLYSVTSAQTFDEYDDAQMVRALDQVKGDVIRDKGEDYVTYNEQALIDAEVLGAPVSEGGMTNVTQLQRLHNGAIWQGYTRQMELQEEVAELKTRLLAIEEPTNPKGLFGKLLKRLAK